MVYRNKTYVAFDGDNDIAYYYLMKAWKQSGNSSFNFYDAHDINTAYDTSLETTIKRRLGERMANSKVFVLLIGERTKYLKKFVKWEIEQALKMDLPIICVNLNGHFQKDDLCPSILKNELAIFIPFKQAALSKALENWPNYHRQYKKKGKTGSYYYK